MKTTTMSNECGAYVAANLFKESHERTPVITTPAITLSRQTGSRGTEICKLLHKTLQDTKPSEATDWKLYDNELVKQILREHDLPEELASFMPESAVNEYQSTINELLGRHPSLWSLFEDSVETIQRLSRKGHCIIVGRGGNHVTRAMSNVLRVCFVGTRQTRLRHLSNREKLTVKEAEALLKKEDRARHSYVRQHFNADADDPHDYDLTINTDHLSNETVVDILIQALKSQEA